MRDLDPPYLKKKQKQSLQSKKRNKLKKIKKERIEKGGEESAWHCCCVAALICWMPSFFL